MRFSIEKLLNAKKNLNYTKKNKKIPDWLKFKNFVHKIEIVMKKTMYGFYPNDIPFVKLSLRNPQDIPKVAAILEVYFTEYISFLNKNKFHFFFYFFFYLISCVVFKFLKLHFFSSSSLLYFDFGIYYELIFNLRIAKRFYCTDKQILFFKKK